MAVQVQMYRSHRLSFKQGLAIGMRQTSLKMQSLGGHIWIVKKTVKKDTEGDAQRNLLTCKAGHGFLTAIHLYTGINRMSDLMDLLCRNQWGPWTP